MNGGKLLSPIAVGVDTFPPIGLQLDLMGK